MIQGLTNTQLFSGIEEEHIQSMLKCLKAHTRSYKKGASIFPEGFPIKEVGIVISGSVLLEFCDTLGTNHIVREIRTGGSFGEEYACGATSPLLLTIRAGSDSQIMFVDASSILRRCKNECECHQKMIENLVFVSVTRSLQLLRKIIHSSPKTIRERLMSYFTEQVKRAGSYTFDLKHNRQQLADFLNVDRSALCNELSKMQKEGLITYNKNHITVHVTGEM